MSGEWTPERMQELLDNAKGMLKEHLESGETVEEQIADSAFNRAAESVIDRSRPGEYRNPDDITIMEALQVQTNTLLGIGLLLEAILKQLRKK